MLLFTVFVWNDGLALPSFAKFPDFQRRIAVNHAVFECGIKDGAEMNQPNSVL